jgi:uncharacterized protein (DUF2345 family)
MDRFYNPAEDDNAEPRDHLDDARVLLEACSDAATDDQGVAFSLKAIAHTLLWQAEQHRNWQRRVDENSRKLKEWHESQPSPPLPAYPAPYQGF